MGWFDSPAIGLRKLVPANALAGFNSIEIYALNDLEGEPAQRKPYQLGLVLAAWIKAGTVAGEIQITPGVFKKVDAISESCAKVLKDKAFTAFMLLARLADQGATFDVPSEVFKRIAVNAASYR